MIPEGMLATILPAICDQLNGFLFGRQTEVLDSLHPPAQHSSRMCRTGTFHTRFESLEIWKSELATECFGIGWR